MVRGSWPGAISLPILRAVGNTGSKHGRNPMFSTMLGIEIHHIPAEFVYIQTYNYIVPATNVVCPVPLIVP